MWNKEKIVGSRGCFHYKTYIRTDMTVAMARARGA